MLVVDEDPLSHRSLRRLLEPEQVEVDSAETPAEALARAAVSPPDVVILDLQLPEMDGLKVVSRLQAQNANVAVIAVTRPGDVRTAVRAIRPGARSTT